MEFAKKNRRKLLWISVFSLLIPSIVMATAYGWSAYWPAGSSVTGGNTNSMIIGISSPASPVYTGFRGFQVAVNSSALPAYANYLCITPTLNGLTQSAFYFNHVAGLLSTPSAVTCQDRSSLNINTFNFGINLVSAGTHNVGVIVWAGYKSADPTIFEGVPAFNAVYPFVNSHLYQFGQIPVSVLTAPQLPPYVTISANPILVPQGSNVSVTYRSNVPVVGSNAVACTASSDSLAPLNNWSGPVAVSNSSNTTVNNVGPIINPTRIMLSCVNSSGMTGYAEITVNTYIPCVDSGVRVKSNSSTFKIGMDPSAPASSLRINKNGTVIGLKLVNVVGSDASPVRVRTVNGTRALQKCP